MQPHAAQSILRAAAKLTDSKRAGQIRTIGENLLIIIIVFGVDIGVASGVVVTVQCAVHETRTD